MAGAASLLATNWLVSPIAQFCVIQQSTLQRMVSYHHTVLVTTNDPVLASTERKRVDVNEANIFLITRATGPRTNSHTSSTRR